jgi:hypothetical protein
MKKYLLPLLAVCALAAPAAAQADTAVSTPTEDSWTISSQPTSVGTRPQDDELWVQAASGSLPTERAYLKFNATVPAGATVQGVSLQVKASGKTYSGTDNGPTVYKVPCTFTEATLTYSNAPATTGSALNSYPAFTNSQAWSTGLGAAAWVGNGEYCFALTPDSTNDLGVWSSEAPTADNRPKLLITYTPAPPPPPADTDGDGVPDSQDLCPATGRLTPVDANGCPIDQPPPTGSLIPTGATLLRANEHNGTGTVSTSQCPSAGSVTEQNGYIRLYRPAGGGQAAGGYRCEIQWSSNIAPGQEHWMEYRARYPVGFQGGCGSWCAGFQIHEANVSGIGAVDAAMFYQSGFQWDGQAIGPTLNASSVNVTDWHTYTTRFVGSTGTTGRIEFWIDGVYYGATVGRNMTVGGNSYIKYGHYGGNDATREAHFDYVRHYQVS